MHQLSLPFNQVKKKQIGKSYRDLLIDILAQDFDFHDQDSKYASHNFHSFPAKFPPQLPRKFINALTQPNEIVLDPMIGSGTTVLEAFLSGRCGMGFDIDPLALLISQAKVTQLNINQVRETGYSILSEATDRVNQRQGELLDLLKTRWDPKTKKFIDYWFAFETQIELMALISEIEHISDEKLKNFFKLIFSAIIITKSGGVSLAFDLAHTRPHRAKVVISRNGEILEGHEFKDSSSSRIKFLTKTIRSALEEFEKRFKQNLNSLPSVITQDSIQPAINLADAQHLPLDEDSVDLIITSPPYASNAIDYMRAHKFSLVWLGYAIDDLSRTRKKYIGGEAITDVTFENLPPQTASIVAGISERDKKKGRVLSRYYSEMTRTLTEMFRILKPDKAAILIVGSSIMRGKDTETQNCLSEIGQMIGFEVPKIGVRKLDRNRRMMPAGFEVNLESQIQQRMHEEYIIGFYKPK